MPERIFKNARLGTDGRMISDSNGCSRHGYMSDQIKWNDGEIECMGCARDYQETLMSEAQRKNVGFHMPRFENWVKRPKFTTH